MNKHTAIEQMNKLGANNTPFLFIIDFDMEDIKIFSDKELGKQNLKFAIKQSSNQNIKKQSSLKKTPITFNDYNTAFNIVIDEIKKGNSYLTNLTAKTNIETDYTLENIFNLSNAPYKLLFKDDFVVFSPETFVKIENKKITSYPMKGTIDAAIPNAEQLILTNKKEEAEHATITDLIRNDLSRIATNVKVDKYRYIDRIKTNEGELLQVSSEISGDLPNGFHKQLGTLFFKLLPAGSISGAPKQKTLEIIKKAENYSRAYYTGVFGYFDGQNMDSAVMIRFIEKQDGNLIFKSGGGITINSNAKDEYDELIKKVYLPF